MSLHSTSSAATVRAGRTTVLHLPSSARTGHAAPGTGHAAPGTGSTPQFESGSLLRGTREVLIRHGGEVYRLRHTRNDKLILTK